MTEQDLELCALVSVAFVFLGATVSVVASIL